jgi:FixJ family two-component response regulator
MGQLRVFQKKLFSNHIITHKIKSLQYFHLINQVISPVDGNFLYFTISRRILNHQNIEGAITVFHIIDNEESLCELAVQMLKIAGYQATAYSNPVEYINYVHSNNYASPMAIFTGVRMPEMSGYELIGKVREKLPEQRIVIISGYGQCNETSRIKVCHFLPKPYSLKKFIAIADAIVRCDKTNSSVVKTTSKSLMVKSNLNMWTCPLDCLECGKRTTQQNHNVNGENRGRHELLSYSCIQLG